MRFLSLKGGCTGSSESTLVKYHIFGNHVSRLNCHLVTDDEVVLGIVSLNPLGTHTNCCSLLQSRLKKPFCNQCRSRSDCSCRSSDLGFKCFPLHIQMPNLLSNKCSRRHLCRLHLGSLFAKVINSNR